MKKKQPKKQKQWAKFIVVLLLYLLFIYWLGSWMGLLVVPFIYDVYISKKINWQWWKEAEGPTKWVMSWVDAIVFALVAVYFINLFFFQNYVIPSSSLEKSLLTGDYLFVSKVSYGPRIPQTPLTMPLTQHTLPVFECKSYIECPLRDLLLSVLLRLRHRDLRPDDAWRAAHGLAFEGRPDETLRGNLCLRLGVHQEQS